METRMSSAAVPSRSTPLGGPNMNAPRSGSEGGIKFKSMIDEALEDGKIDPSLQPCLINPFATMKQHPMGENLNLDSSPTEETPTRENTSVSGPSGMGGMHHMYPYQSLGAINSFPAQTLTSAATAEGALPEARERTSEDRTLSREWDASKVPPSQFQRRKGSIYATPSSRDSQKGRERDQAFYDKLREKVSANASASGNFFILDKFDSNFKRQPAKQNKSEIGLANE